MHRYLPVNPFWDKHLLQSYVQFCVTQRTHLKGEPVVNFFYRCLQWNKTLICIGLKFTTRLGEKKKKRSNCCIEIFIDHFLGDYLIMILFEKMQEPWLKFNVLFIFKHKNRRVVTLCTLIFSTLNTSWFMQLHFFFEDDVTFLSIWFFT